MEKRKKNQKVSIIVAVYQSERTIERCIQSILAQDYQNWQAIFVDDASTDGGPDIIRVYAEEDSRFTIKINPVNEGVAKTRNTALDIAEGEYIAFLDADDWWDEKMLSSLINEAAATGADIVQCGYMYDYANRDAYVPPGVFDSKRIYEKAQFPNIYWKMMTGIKMNHVCMKLIRRELTEGLRFNTALKTAEDLAFCVELIPRAERYAYIPEPMYHYYRSASSLTSGGLSFRDKWSANRYVSKLMLKSLGKWNMDNAFYAAVVWLRPYLLIIPKILRIFKDIFHSKISGGGRDVHT